MKVPFSWFGNGGHKDEDIRPENNGADKDPFFIEQVKAMRAKFEYRIDMHNVKVVAVTSAIAGEGKTLSSTHLAINLATAGRKKILLVDVDLRKSDLARRLNISPLPGLSEYLSGSAVSMKDIVRNSFWPGLYVIPGGMRIKTPADLLTGPKFRAFLEGVRGQFDLVLLDTPPILPVSDTLSLRDQVDGFVFLFRTNFTPHTMLRQAVEEVGEEKIIGVVLNGVETRSQRYYQKYYGRYYQKIKKEETTA